nr:PAS domain S-box protein [Bacteroidota bacterium]
MSKQKLNLLILENNPDDAELIVRELEKEGFVLEWERVDTEKEFKKALAKNPEIILADYKLPSYNGIAAIKLQRKTAPDIPLIIVSGTIGDELAVECLKAGATDYVLKNRLSRLSLVVKRALKEAKEHSELKQADKQLKESEQKFRNIFENANDGIIYLDNLGRIIDVNEKAAQFFGGTKEELINKHFTKIGIFSPKNIQNLLKNFKKALSNEKFLIDIAITNKKGKHIHLECSTTRERQEGKTTGLIVIARDITDYKQAEEILRKSEEKYQLITESTSDVISLHTFDLDAVYTYVSPSIKTLGGYEPEELIGKSCFDFIHPEDKKILLPLLQKYIRSKIKSLITRKKISVKETFEYRIKDKSGKWRYIQSTGNIVGDQFLFVSRDITKNKQAEESLRKSEEKYRNLVEKLEEGIVSIDENENFIFVNNATSKIFGYPKKEIIKKNLKDFTTPHEFKKIIEQTSVRKKGKSSKYEINIIKKDGSHGVISITASPIFDDNKKYTGAFGIIRDITERKKAEEKEKEHHKNIELLSETAMQFVEFPQDKNIYAFIGEQFQEFAGKDSYVAVNSIDTETKILTTRAVIGMGKLSKKVTGLLGKHPVGMTYDTKDKDLLYFSDGKLHLYKEGLYGLALKIIPKTVCNSIEKLLNIKKIYGIGFTKDNKLFGTIAIFLKESAGELKNKQIIEAFIKQASIAVQKRQAEKALKASNENFQQVVSNITTVVWKADIGKNGAFENTYTSPVVDELLELPAGTLKNDWNKYFSYIKPEYLERVNNAFKEAIISPGKVINCEYEVLKDNGQTAWFHSHGRCFEKKGKLHVFGSTMDITERKRIESKLKQNENMLRQIIDTSPNCIFVKDRNGMYLVANKRMAELHSTTPEEFVGKYDYKVAQQWFETVDYNEFRKAEQNVIDNKKTLFINEEPFVYH